RLAVKRIPFGKQALEHRLRIRLLQQRASLVVAGASQLHLHRRPQVDNNTTIMQVTTIRLAYHHATTGGHDDAGLLRQLVDHFLFATTKAVLSLDIEDPRNIGASALFNDLVGVEERTVQDMGEVSPKGAFTSTHGPDQEDTGSVVGHDTPISCLRKCL